MQLRRLHFSEVLPMSIDEAWRFFSDPANLALITPPEMGFDIVTPTTESMYAGMIIAFRVRPLFGIPTEWVTEITHVREPHFFVDEQRIGPYRFWHHQHRFREVSSGVEVEDIVHYALPFGFLGRILDKLLVRRKVESIFEYRTKALTTRFSSEKGNA